MPFGIWERLLAGRWIAGPDISDAIRGATNISKYNITPILNYLGEEYTKRSDVSNSIRKYTQLIAKLSERKINANISLKATQLGLRVSREYASNNYSNIVKIARKVGIFVWLDMEDSTTTDDTIRMYNKEVRNAGVGICIQAYLKRSMEDVHMLLSKSRHAEIRLVKGAYTTTDNNFIKDRTSVTKNYLSIMHYLFKSSKHFTIATHDDTIISNALRLSKNYKSDVTFSMLRGIRSHYLLRLAESGARTSMYIPFGGEWISYSYRRLKEQGHMSLIFRSLFERQI